MIFIDGFPRDTGASDMKDSARLAGLMGLFCHPLAPHLDLYINGNRLARHPSLSPDDFSRDQLLPLIAGLSKQCGPEMSINYLIEPLLARSRTSNGDWLDPAHKLHLKLCAGLSGNWFGYLWLMAQIVFHAKITPLAEPNQLIAQLVIAGPKYVGTWTKLNTRWRESISSYWSGWREESAFSSFLIRAIEDLLLGK